MTADDTHSPELNAIRAEPGPRDHLTLHGQLNCSSITVKLVSSQKLPDRLLVSNYDARVLRLSGEIQMRIACIANELFVMACFDGRPKMDVKLQLTDAVTNEGGSVDQGLVEEAIRQCLMSAVTNLSLNPGAGVMGAAPGGGPPLPSPVEEVFRNLNQNHLQLSQMEKRNSSSNLLVKVIRAHKLGCGGVVTQPFVTVEMDEPVQKHTTTLGLNVSPYWDEHFLFDLTSNSEELLFEVYDRSEDSHHIFLGLAIVGIAELRRATAQTHVLTLQSRPYRKDEVSGTLTVEFVFMHPSSTRMELRHHQLGAGMISSTTAAVSHKHLGGALPASFDANEMRVIPTQQQTVLVKSVSQMPSTAPQQAPPGHHHDLHHSAHPIPQSQSTHQYQPHHPVQHHHVEPVVHASEQPERQRNEPAPPAAETHSTHKKDHEQSTQPLTGAPFADPEVPTHPVLPGEQSNPPQHQHPTASVPSHVTAVTKDDSHSAPIGVTPSIASSGSAGGGKAQGGADNHSPAIEPGSSSATRISRPRQPVNRAASEDKPSSKSSSKSRSLPRPAKFFGDLRARLSGRGASEHVMTDDETAANTRINAGLIRATSLDRSHQPASVSATEEFSIEPGRTSVSNPPSRDASEHRRGDNLGMRSRDSNSDVSEASTDSIAQHSTLVVEVVENNVKRYFLIPPNMVGMQATKRLMKKGKKLHIHNEHTFVATRLQSATQCNVCSKNIVRAFGKQAYQCRAMTSSAQCLDVKA